MRYICIIYVFLFSSMAGAKDIPVMPQEYFLNIHTPNKNNEISIGFTGQKLHIYGTTNVKGNIIIVFKGQDTSYVLSKKVRKFIFWLNEKIVQNIQTPQFYAMNTLYPMQDTYQQNPLHKDLYIGIKNLPYKINKDSEKHTIQNSKIWDVITDIKSKNTSYQTNIMSVFPLSPYMFETSIHIPSDMSPGMYTVSAFVNDAPTYLDTPTRILASDEKTFYIGRSPLIKFIYSSARDYPSIYGIFAILASLLIGLGAGILRRKR